MKERLPNGRFPKGVSGNPNGRPSKAVAMREAVLNAVTNEELMSVFGAMIRRAQDGDVPAARLVCEYTIGKPKEEVELSGALSWFKAIERQAAEEV